MRIDRITRKREEEILIEDERIEKSEREREKKEDFHRSQDVAGVTVNWNSPAALLGVVDVVGRGDEEEDEEERTASDEGMS